MKKIGILGDIGSGKTFVAKKFDCPVFVADDEVSKIYSKNPLEVALEFQDNGVENIHIVDLDGARSNKIRNFKIIEKIVREALNPISENITALKLDMDELKKKRGIFS